MRSSFSIIGSALLLCACGASAGNEAAKKYDLLKTSGATVEELCTEAAKVSKAYLEDQDEANLKVWKAKERQQCEAQKAAEAQNKREAEEQQRREKRAENKREQEAAAQRRATCEAEYAAANPQFDPETEITPC